MGANALITAVFVIVPADPYGGDDLLIVEPMFWLFWTVCGAITGFAYWRSAAGA